MSTTQERLSLVSPGTLKGKYHEADYTKRHFQKK